MHSLRYEPTIILRNKELLHNITTIFQNKTNVTRPQQSCGFSQIQATSAQLQSQAKHKLSQGTLNRTNKTSNVCKFLTIYPQLYHVNYSVTFKAIPIDSINIYF